jgi:hypothetical protein
MLPLILGAALSAAQSGAPVHAPAIEAHLAPLVGDWTRPGQETTYRDHCVWYDRRAFVVCSLTDRLKGGRVEAIMGYSAADQRYTYQNYANNGSSRVQYGYPLGANGLVFTDEQKMDGKPVRLTTSLIPQPDGRLRIVQERSVMGGPWQQVGEVYYVKRK